MAGQSSEEIIHHHLTHLNAGSGFWSLDIDTLLFSMALGALFCWWFYRMAQQLASGKATFGSTIAMMIFKFIDGTVKELFGYSRADIGSLALVIFVWVFLWNTMDMIPVDLIPNIASYLGIHYFKIVPSVNPNATFGISIVVILLTYIYLYKNSHGLNGFIKSIGSHPFEAHGALGKIVLYPINLGLKIIEDVAKMVSLAMRLYGNMFAGELVFVLISLLPWPAQILPGGAWAIFHILVISVQAYVAMILSVVYLSMTEVQH